MLFLTKRLGTGIVLQAQRDGIAPAGALDPPIESMLELNRAAADALRPFEPNAVTDVTGFGLLGHTLRARLAKRRPGVLDAESLPALAGCPGARGRRRPNRRRPPEPRLRRTARREPAPRRLEALAFDPQTAGGLLVSMPAERAPVLEATLAAQGIPAARIGRVEEGAESSSR